jgi:lipoprotein-anchoring transpeptidase ErfK/SrfK
MRTVLILIVIAALGFAGWTWYQNRGTTPAPAVPPPVAAPIAPTPAPIAAVPAAVKADYDQAEALWKQIEATGQNPAAGAKAPFLGKLYGKVLRGIYNQPGLKTLEDSLVADRLSKIGNEVFFSKNAFTGDDTGFVAIHKVAPGESPAAIARKYGMSMELINRLRGRDPNASQLNVGDVVKVLKIKEHGGFLIHVDKGDYTFDLFAGGIFMRRYEISHGAPETPTPVGTTHLVARERNPTWTHPVTHEVFGPDDPRNILGKVWMKFDKTEIGQDGLGIHGYTGPDAKWKAQVSNGCIRMKPDDAVEVYQSTASPSLAPTTVEIVE